jgi:UDP-N-acetylglucosamine transferase subunit ALG13
VTPLVLVLVGTDYHPFDRLVGWMDDWAARHAGSARVLVQRGTSRPTVHADSVEFVEYSEVQRLISEASVVVAHGGPSTISECRRQGLLPIVVPRDPSHGEHVDAHQMLFSGRLAAGGSVLRAETEPELLALLDRALVDPTTVALPEGSASDVATTCARFGAAVDALFGARPAAPRAVAVTLHEDSHSKVA